MAKRNPLTRDEQAQVVRQHMDEESLTIDEYVEKYGDTANLKDGIELIRKEAQAKPARSKGSGPVAPSFPSLRGSRLF